MIQKSSDRQVKTTNLEAGLGTSNGAVSATANSTTTEIPISTAVTSSSIIGGAVGGSSNDLPILESTSGAIRKKPREHVHSKSNDRPSTMGVVKETNRSASAYSSSSLADGGPANESSSYEATTNPLGSTQVTCAVTTSVTKSLSPVPGPVVSSNVAAAPVVPEAVLSDEEELEDEDTDNIRLSGDGEQGL